MDSIAIGIGEMLGRAMDPIFILLCLCTAAIPVYRFAPPVNAVIPAVLIASFYAANADNAQAVFVGEALLRYPAAVLWCWLVWSMKKKGALAFW